MQTEHTNKPDSLSRFQSIATPNLRIKSANRTACSVVRQPRLTTFMKQPIASMQRWCLFLGSILLKYSTYLCILEYILVCGPNFNDFPESNASEAEPVFSPGFTIAHIIGTVLGVVGGTLLIACIVTAYRNRSRDNVERARLLQQRNEGKQQEMGKRDLESQSTTAGIDKSSSTEIETFIYDRGNRRESQS
ncbi:hypothetical protein QBC36DRAFT_362908 [Triangularia setosa]|uniref:Uncharacterized protein n=1 Tax=Triangularia setosa TaxID=2587417 RepID=A0AAN6WCG8_9PEZI|nr:hypothetical protein QBC36DRAFT_362908 [Podospora setosa]